MQAVALVFEHVGSAHENSNPNGEAGVKQDLQDEGSQRKGSAKVAQQGAANAALKLLDDLCMMATGIDTHSRTKSASDIEKNSSYNA